MAKRNEGEVKIDHLLWRYSANNEGKHPVKLRVTFQRHRKYYQVLDEAKEKVFMTEETYSIIVGTDRKKLGGKNRKLRDLLDDAVTNGRDAKKEATNSGKDPFSFPEFERKLLGEESNSQFLKYFKSHLDKLGKKGQAGTVRVYGSVLSSFAKFLGNKDPKNIVKDIDPAEITPDKLQDYEDTLREGGYSDTWISICMRSIRAIYNRIAVKDEYLKAKYPFSRNDYDELYKIPISTGQKGQTLTKDEMIDFISGKVDGDKIPENPMYRAKMLFLFSFYGQGLNFKDIALLRNSNKKGNNIEFERQKTIRTRKTATVVRIPITKELGSILLEIGNPDTRKSSYMFEVFDPGESYTPKQIDAKVLQFVKTTNKWLKRYCEFNEIPIISTYAARHTFASLAKVHLPLAQISKMLGHSKIETTQIYLGRFEDGENRNALNKVFKTIKKKKSA